ncbi:thiamine pyrophosphate-binding protein [Streptomyces sp. NPDC005805]|uniref:thiamine pyrophosphate-binding protein n=1 Tax=Streptomyces sp. NPDC005805 TaxID=3157068 RepID=UPI00340C08F9
MKPATGTRVEGSAAAPAAFTGAAAVDDAGPRTFVAGLVAALRGLGVDTVFGIPGGAVGPLFHELIADRGVDLVVARHESGAVAMADGWARVRRSLAVAVATSGPGALNALPHLAVADTDNSPVLLVTGQSARPLHGRGSFQEGTDDHVNIAETFRHCTRYSRELTHAASAPTVVRAALRAALAAPRGAAHLALPVDLSFEPDEPGTWRPVEAVAPPSPSREALQDIAHRLLDASRPLVLLGNGARGALADPVLLRRLVAASRRHVLPVATTGKAKGVFPESSCETALGVLGTGGSARAHAYGEAGPPDVVLVVGSGLGEWATRRWTTALQAAEHLCQVDADPARTGHSYDTHRTVIADAGAFLTGLLDVWDSWTGPGRRPGAAAVRPRRERGAAGRRRHALRELPSVAPAVHTELLSARPVKPQAVMAGLREWLTGVERAHVFLDIGNTTGWFTQYVPVDPPHRLHVPLGMASMGWANAAVIGAKTADPDATCVAVTGDGGFLMNAVEISTAAHHGIGALWVVLYDNTLNMVRQGMHAAFPGSDAHATEDFSLGGPDLVLLARSLGADAHRVTDPAQLAAALDRAADTARSKARPQVVVVHTDPAEPGPFDDRNRAVSSSFAAAPAADTPMENR